MPIYEYQCGKCGVFEVTQRITEPALKRCPTCKGKVERQMSVTSFVLKGSGWYATDYAKSGAHSKPDTGSSETKANGATDSSSSSTDSTTKSASDSATKPGDSASSAKTSAPEPAAKPSAKSKAPAAKSAD